MTYGSNQPLIPPAVVPALVENDDPEPAEETQVSEAEADRQVSNLDDPEVQEAIENLKPGSKD